MKKILIILFLFILSNPTRAYFKYEVPCLKSLLDISGKLALQQVGTKEKTGHNDGIKIEGYLLSVGLNPKGQYPYCASGQYWCFLTGSEMLNLKFADIPVYKTGSTVVMLNQAMKSGIKVKPIPEVNDLIFWVAKTGSTGHVERIVGLFRAGWVVSVGFNTSSGTVGSQDNGGGVFLRKRCLYHFLGRLVFRGSIGFKPI